MYYAISNDGHIELTNKEIICMGAALNKEPAQQPPSPMTPLLQVTPATHTYVTILKVLTKTELLMVYYSVVSACFAKVTCAMGL